MISSPIEEIKSRLDIVDVVQGYIRLQKAGVNYRAVCPFHSEKKPSFFVSPSRQTWHCFGACSEGGDIFKFVMKVEGVEFGDALRILAQKAGVELKREDPKLKTERQRIYEISELATSFFQKQLSENSEAKKYISNRGISDESIKEWRIGYAPEAWQGLSDFIVSRGYTRQEAEKAGLALKSEKTGNYYDRFRSRIIFPIFDFNNQVIGFGGRIFKEGHRPDGQDEAKYINTPATLLYDKSRVLYGLNKAGIEIRKNDACVMVEGYIDAVMAHQAGSKNVVAVSGTALTEFHLKILKRYSNNLWTAFDMDTAGNSATKRGIDLAQALGFDIRVITMPEGLDPADVASRNKEEWMEIITKSKSIHDFYFESALSKFDKNSLEGKKEISKFLLPIIKKIPTKIEQALWINDLSNILGVKEEAALADLEEIKTEEKEVEVMGEPVIKPRTEMLEEYLAVLCLKSPKNIELLEENDLSSFTSCFSKMLCGFKKTGIPEIKDYDPMLSPLIIKAEELSDYDIDIEFKNCLREIRGLSVRNRLDEVSKEIRKAEQDKDFNKIQTLMQLFNELSKSRREIENA